MTNRNDDDFNFDDDLFGTDPAPDTDADLNFDEDPLGDLSDDDFNFDDDVNGGRTNRTFVVLAFIIILLFIAGVAAIVLFALNRGPTDIDRTRTAIAVLNTTQEAFLLETGTASAQNVASTATAAVIAVTTTAIANEQGTAAAVILQTQQSVDATQTELARPTETPSPTTAPTEESDDNPTPLPPAAQATADAQTATQAALNFEATQTEAAAANAATQTSVAADAAATEVAQNAADRATADAATLSAEQTNAALFPPTATGQLTPGGISPENVRQTATALSQTLSPVTQVATLAVTPAIGGTSVMIMPTRLPETGLFDDIGGGNSFGVLALVALGLVGVIFGARRLRK